jgi:hypothetical protein
MKGHGPREERETIIRFNESDDTAVIWTASDVIYRRIRRRGYQPFEDCDRHAEFHIARADIKLPRPKRVRVLSDKQRETLRNAGFSRDAREKMEPDGPKAA